MMKVNSESRHTILIGSLLFLLTFSVYILTLCPTVYWYDSGELTAACYHLGIAHPTGYPLYTMLGRIFALLPIGEIAQRVNIMSAFFGAMTVVFLYCMLKMLISVLWRDDITGSRDHRWLQQSKTEIPAIAASLAFAFSPLFWTQTTIAEVYTVHTFLFVLLIFSLIFWTRSPIGRSSFTERSMSRRNGRSKFLFLFGFLLGLSCGHHLTILLFVPAFIAFIIASEPRILKQYRLMIVVFIFFLLGLSVDLYLLVRAGLDPVQNWGNPDTWQRFKDVVTGFEIRSRPTRYAPHSIGELFSLLGHQFLLPGVTLAILGTYSTIRRDIRLFILFILTFIGMVLYIFRNYDFLEDQYLPVFLIFALLIGIGARELIFMLSSAVVQKYTRARKGIALGVLTLLPAFPFFLFASNFHTMDRSRQRAAYYYGEHVLASLEPEALVLSEGSNVPLLLDYHQRVEKKRLDVVNSYLFLMEFDWYRTQLSQRFPKMSVPILPEHTVSRFIEQNVRSHRVYYAPFSKEPNVDLSRLIPSGFLFRIEQGRTIPSTKDIQDHFRIQEGFYRSLARPLDQASKDILTQLHGTMGLYFERTGLFDEALQEYTKALEIDSLNPGVHYDLGSLAMGTGMFTEAIDYFQRVLSLEPANLHTRYLLGQCYVQTGDMQKAVEEMERVVRSEPDEPRFRLELGVLYGQIGNVSRAIRQFESGLERDPHQPDLLFNLGVALAKSRQLDKAIPYLERAIREDSTSVEIAYALASSYAEQRDFKKAERYYLRALSIGGPNPAIFEDLGYLYRESGRLRLAIEAWRASLEMNPNNTNLKTELHFLEEKMKFEGKPN